MKKKNSGNRYVKNNAVLLRLSSRRAFSVWARYGFHQDSGSARPVRRDEGVFQAGAAHGDVRQAQAVAVAPAHDLRDAFAGLVGAQERVRARPRGARR